jgi:hypothetical protein
MTPDWPILWRELLPTSAKRHHQIYQQLSSFSITPNTSSNPQLCSEPQSSAPTLPCAHAHSLLSVLSWPRAPQAEPAPAAKHLGTYLQHISSTRRGGENHLGGQSWLLVLHRYRQSHQHHRYQLQSHHQHHRYLNGNQKSSTLARLLSQYED